MVRKHAQSRLVLFVLPSTIFLRQSFGAGMAALIARGEYIKREVAAEYQR